MNEVVTTQMAGSRNGGDNRPLIGSGRSDEGQGNPRGIPESADNRSAARPRARRLTFGDYGVVGGASELALLGWSCPRRPSHAKVAQGGRRRRAPRAV